MAEGKRRRNAQVATIWVATQDLPRTSGYPFYARLNQILDEINSQSALKEILELLLRGVPR